MEEDIKNNSDRVPHLRLDMADEVVSDIHVKSLTAIIIHAKVRESNRFKKILFISVIFRL